MLAIACVANNQLTLAKNSIREAVRVVNESFPEGDHPAVISVHRAAAEVWEATEQYGVALRNKQREYDAVVALFDRLEGAGADHPRAKQVREELDRLNDVSRAEVAVSSRRYRQNYKIKQDQQTADQVDHENDKADDNEDNEDDLEQEEEEDEADDDEDFIE